MKYDVYETNAGGLILVVFGADGWPCYVHSGYELVPGQLTRDIDLLRGGANPILDGWGNNELGELGEGFFDSCLIADNDGCYPKFMGAAGRLEFGEV